jgi:hypothetical protein
MAGFWPFFLQENQSFHNEDIFNLERINSIHDLQVFPNGQDLLTFSVPAFSFVGFGWSYHF